MAHAIEATCDRQAEKEYAMTTEALHCIHTTTRGKSCPYQPRGESRYCRWHGPRAPLGQKRGEAALSLLAEMATRYGARLETPCTEETLCDACDLSRRVRTLLKGAGVTVNDGPPTLDPRHQPTPAPATTLDHIEIPKALRSAAMFGPEPKGAASPEDLAQYLDSYPLLPYEADLDLEPSEVVYLTRPVRFGWEELTRSGEIVRGFSYPDRQALLPWVRLLGKLPSYPGDALPRKRDGVVHLTNWRIFFGSDRGVPEGNALDSILLADIVGVECYRDRLVLAANGRVNRLVLLVKNPMQVGLCFARALRDMALLPERTLMAEHHQQAARADE